MSEILQWTMNYSKLFDAFCNHQTNQFIDILWYVVMNSTSTGLKGVGSSELPHCSRCRSGLKTHENIHDFFSTELNSLTFFWWECFWFIHEFLWLSNDFRLTSQTRTHPGGKMARCSFFGCFSAAPFVVFGGNSFPVYTARGSQNARNPGIFSFPSLTGWCWWPICLAKNLHPENARRSAFPRWFVQICSKLRLFPGNDAASNRCIHVFTEDVQVQVRCCSINRLQHGTSSPTLSSLRGVNVHVDKIAHRSIFSCPDKIHIQTWWIDGL